MGLFLINYLKKNHLNKSKIMAHIISNENRKFIKKSQHFKLYRKICIQTSNVAHILGISLIIYKKNVKKTPLKKQQIGSTAAT